MTQFYRFSNAVLRKNVNVNDTWDILQKIKTKIAFDTYCKEGLYSEAQMTLNINTVEEKLNISSSKIIFPNWTNAELKSVADMFLYLNSCSDQLKPWFLFYTDLFRKKSAEQIILILNRILKVHESPKSKDFKNIGMKLFERSYDLFSLKHKEIKMIINGMGNSTWFENFNKILRGM